MSDTKTTIQIGPSGGTILTIVFVLLKVFGYINWSWVWVFAPLWIGFAIFFATLAFIFVVGVLGAILDSK